MVEIYNTATLLGVYRDVRDDNLMTYWSDLCFNAGELAFDTEEVNLERIPNTGRKLAPLVMPLAQGRPVYTRATATAMFKPAYLKPKDAITPTSMMVRAPGEILSPTPSSPAARRNATIANILKLHRTVIDRRREWMCSEAIQKGSITLIGDDYPEQVVDFQRAAGHTVTLGSGARWGDSGISIIDNIQSWADTMAAAPFGGNPTRITMGTSVWAVVRKDAEIKALMDKNTRGSDVLTVERGLIERGYARKVGDLGTGIEMWVYNDFYTIAGTPTQFLDPRDIVLTSPAVQGFRCYGAIQDAHANFQPFSVYPRNWIADDPPIEFVMTQSAPLMVPINPNATFRARVLA